MFILERAREGRPVSFSAIENERIKLFEEQMSLYGVVYGGRILEIVEGYAKRVAEKHSDVKCFTSGIDFVRFYSPAKRGDILILKSSVNRAWHFSLEVGVKVLAEDFRSLEQKHILSAYFTFQARDENNKPILISKLITENDEQKRRYDEAQKRRSKNRKSHCISRLDI